jgi:imidazolonepropionase-like amidohydrolase
VPIAIVGATVVHPGGNVEAGATVVITGERITSVGGPTPPGARVIDAHGKWIIPGLIDTHVHFFQSGNPLTRPDMLDLTKTVPYAQEVARNKARLPVTFQVSLASGVTTVADVGGPMWNFEVRERAKTMPAPRVFVAGPLLSMVSREQLALDDPPIIKVGTVDEAQALVRREIERKPDFLKVWFIHNPRNDDLKKQEEIVKAAGDAAHAAGVPLAVHATEREVATAALRAGADRLVHSVGDLPVDDEFIELAKKNHAIYTPTLFVIAGYALVFSGKWAPTEAEQRLADPTILDAIAHTTVPEEAISPRAKQRMAQVDVTGPAKVDAANLLAVWNAGIPVSMGTDAGNIGTVHGPSVFREMELMVKAGLSPAQALTAATANGAKFVRMENELGDVAPGKLADLVVLDADPLADVANLSRAFRVVKDGVVYDPADLMRAVRAAPR